MFWGYFINNLDFGFGSVGISIGVGDGFVIDQDFDGRDFGNFDSSGKGWNCNDFDTKAGRLTAYAVSLPKMEINSRNHPL